MSDDPDWEKAKDGCYYHAWYRHLGYDPDDKYTVHCEYKPKIDDTPPEALETAADAMGEWDQEKADAKIREMESKVTAPKRCTCGQAKSGAGWFHSDWCDLATGG